MDKCKGNIFSGNGIAFEEKAHILSYIGDGVYGCDVEGCNKKFTLVVLIS